MDNKKNKANVHYFQHNGDMYYTCTNCNYDGRVLIDDTIKYCPNCGTEFTRKYTGEGYSSFRDKNKIIDCSNHLLKEKKKINTHFIYNEDAIYYKCSNCLYAGTIFKHSTLNYCMCCGAELKHKYKPSLTFKQNKQRISDVMTDVEQIRSENNELAEEKHKALKEVEMLKAQIERQNTVISYQAKTIEVLCRENLLYK